MPRPDQSSITEGLSLHGLRVLIPRPQSKATALADIIEKAGADAYIAPVISIQGSNVYHGDLSSYDWWLFTSTHAIHFSKPYWPRPLPNNLKIATVGRRSAQILETLIAPSQTVVYADNSEGLLTDDQLQNVEGQKIALISGKGGRKLLTRRLNERGARVTKLPFYERQTQQVSWLRETHSLSRRHINAVIATSGDCLRALMSQLNSAEKNYIQQQPVIAFSERIANIAKKLGFSQPPMITSTNDNQAILRCLTEMAKGARHG